MQTEDYVNNESKALNGHFAANLPFESNEQPVQMICFTLLVESIQRTLHRAPNDRVLIRSEAALERENSGFSV